MSRKSKRILTAAFVLWLLAVTCNLPTGTAQPVMFSDQEMATTAVAKYLASQGVAPDAATATPNPPTATLNPTATPCQPMVMATTDVNVRNGPGSVYDIIGALPTGAFAPLAGRNESGSWWYIAFPGGVNGFAWVSANYATAACAPQVVAVVAAPPTPTSPPPTKTEKANLIVPHLIVTMNINPYFILGDIRLVDIFQSTSKKIMVRVAVTPTSAFNGTMVYKVWLDGTLKETKWVSLPAGEVAYTTQVIVPAGNHSVRVQIDATDKFHESNEGNNDVTVTCNGSDLSCH